jgi:hypothetical protein
MKNLTDTELIMKRYRIALVALMIILATACKKDDAKPSKPNPKKDLIDCRSCGGAWDITDSIP